MDKRSCNGLSLGFIGFGLIGGSIAKALKKQDAGFRVLVYSRRKNPDLEVGVRDGVIDEIVYEIDDHFSSCDVIFLCAPVRKIIDLLPQVAEVAAEDSILTDVGSVKGEICRVAAELGLSRRFIGGHPMAGSEKTGYASATDILLENAFYLLTPSGDNRPEDVELLQELVSMTGATCVVLDPVRHDQITAAISHVPHLLAAALVNLVRRHDDEEQTMKTFAAGGFRDITRIASSSPQMWEEICLSNATAIEELLDELETMIRDYRDEIQSQNGAAIYTAFEEAGEYRDSLPHKATVLVGKIHELFVNVDDRPGAIAEISTILFKGGLNIKNIGIINNREFADGVLRIELTNEADTARAKTLLTDNSYEIVDRQ
ncbi:MAG: prephenate dehydrogenase [Eubacterium sp.]|nr:prephenate dehydrogenase [Eubacterium sp.]